MVTLQLRLALVLSLPHEYDLSSFKDRAKIISYVEYIGGVQGRFFCRGSPGNDILERVAGAPVMQGIFR
jgi:hypothetical protein